MTTPARSRRSGFTLGEMLVVLGVLAALGAVLAPSLVRQVTAARASRILSDVRAIGDAARAFYRDTERWPGTVSQLTNRLATDGSARDLNGAPIPPDLARNWSGPYLRLSSTAGLATGFGPSISNTLAAASTAGGVRVLVVTVTEVDAAEFSRIDLALDGGDGASAGAVLYAPATRTLTYHAAPV